VRAAAVDDADSRVVGVALLLDEVVEDEVAVAVTVESSGASLPSPRGTGSGGGASAARFTGVRGSEGRWARTR